MARMFVKNGQLVVPGELIAEGGFKAGENTYEREGKIYACRVGLVKVSGSKVSVVALEGCYLPKVGDFVIGKIVNVERSGWIVDINSPYLARLPFKTADLKIKGQEVMKKYKIGDFIKGKIMSFDFNNGPVLETFEAGLGKVLEEKVVEICPMKIPRLIGRRGSMIKMLKNRTNCNIQIGQNGRILIKGTPEQEKLIISILKKIEAEAHIPGLTDRVSQMISSYQA